jgi:hypothetical protein
VFWGDGMGTEREPGRGPRTKMGTTRTQARLKHFH